SPKGRGTLFYELFVSVSPPLGEMSRSAGGGFLLKLMTLGSMPSMIPYSPEKSSVKRRNRHCEQFFKNILSKFGVAKRAILL
ncbi:MAG: hypothetical protein IKN96_02415, partial [Oscillibacter sp.]|nr:hypothetical protein [Oscillibacter sp.]